MCLSRKPVEAQVEQRRLFGFPFPTAAVADDLPVDFSEVLLAGRPEADVAFPVLPRFPVPRVELPEWLEFRATAIDAALDERHPLFLGAPCGLEVTPRVLYSDGGKSGWSGPVDPARRRQMAKLVGGGTWTVYMLRCADGSLYTGITTDVIRRCQQHNAGTASRYTRSRRPTHLVYEEVHANRSQASKREAAIKALSRRQKESLIRLAG
jgi:predicted GIY-YIG superfamily endonuclease